MTAVLTDEQKSFISLLNRLERGKTPLDRSLIVRKALLLLANTRNESVSVDVEKKIAMTPPPEAIVRPQSKVNSAPNSTSDAAGKDEEVLAVGEQPLSEQQQETIDTIMTISAPCVVSIESSLSGLFASYHSEKRRDAEAAKKSDGKAEEEAASNTTAAANTKGGKKKGGKGGNNNKQQKGAETDAKNNNSTATAGADSSEDAATKVDSHHQLPISSAKHRLLLYRFLLNGLADVREEEQLLMAAAPLFASEASDDHKRSHDRGVTAILSGILASQNVSLKAALKFVPSADDASESATGNAENGAAESNSFAREVLLGLVLYFEQKTNTFVFTSPTAATSHAMSGSNSEHHQQQKHALSKQGRFFDAVAALSYVVAEGLATENNVQEYVAEAEEGIEVIEEEQKKEEKGEEEKVEDGAVELKENSSEKPAGDEHRLPLETFLSTLFSLLNRFVPIFLPLRGEEQLFNMSAMPDLLRLMLQYHDPILSMHLDRHPQPRRARASPSQPEFEHQDDAVASGATKLSDVSSARTMADAAYHYLTGAGCASLFSRAVAADFTSPPVTSSSPTAPSSPAQINNEVLALLDLIILRYDDSRYFGCLSFVATVLLHRGSILKLSDGEAIANFWGKFAAGAFADNTQICLSALPISEVEEAAAKLPEAAVDQPKDDAVKALAMAVLASQSRAHHKDRLPPVLEPLAGLIHYYCCSSSSAARQSSSNVLPFAAIVAAVVRNLAKNTPSSAKVFSTAVLSATNRGQAQSPRSREEGSVEVADDAAALGAMAMGAVEGMTISESIERHRIYVSSFPVMPVTAEELVLVFPAGTTLVSSPDTPSASSSEPSPSSENKEARGGDKDDGEAHTTVAAPSTSASSARAHPSGGDATGAYSSSHLQYLVLDSRAENSFLFARLPTAIHIGSGIGFDSAQLAATVFQLQDAWSSHLTIMGTGRTILEEHNLLKLIAMRLVEKGFPYVSIVDGGFKACIPYLKAGQMEFVQSPQEARDECARRDAAATAASASHHHQQQQHQQHPNTSRTTLDTTEEIAGEIASQAALIKDKAAEGLKKTGENLSEAASTAALWGTNVWHKLSTTAKERLQNVKADAVGIPFTAPERQDQDPEYQDPESFASNTTPPTPPTTSGGFFSSFISKVKEEAVIASSTVATTASAAAATASSGVVAAAQTASTVVAAAPTSAAATGTAGFFTNLIGKVKGSDAAAEGSSSKVSPDSHRDQHHQQQQQHQQAAMFTTAGGRGAGGGNNAYGDDDDDDDDLGLILSVEPSSNNLNNVAPANNNATDNSNAAVPLESELVHPQPPQTTDNTDSKVRDEEPAVETAEKPTLVSNADENQAQNPPIPKPAVAAATPAAHPSKAVSASNAIDDLFGDMDDIVGGGASRGASPNVTRALPVASKTTSGAKPTAPSNVFDDIFGDDF